MSKAQTETHATRPRGRSIVGPLVLIVVGVLLLLQNLGIVPASIWSTVINLWPILLIVVGLEIIFGRGSVGGAIAFTVLIIVIVSIGASFSFMPWGSGDFRVGSFVPFETVRLSEEIGQVRQINYDLSLGSGTLNVSTLPQDTGNLLEADLERDEVSAVERSIDRQGEQARVSIKARDTRQSANASDSSGRGRWTLRISPQAATSLRVNTGASETVLSLRDATLTSLDLNTGVGSVKVDLPKPTGRLNVSVNAGVGGVNVVIPLGTAAQIKANTGLGSVNLDEARFEKIGRDLYRTRDYDSTTNRIDLSISSGIGGTTIR